MQPRRALALAGICIMTAGCSSHSTQATPTATVSTSATTSTAATPLAEAALDGLLLSPAEINTAMGASQLSVTRDTKDMVDNSASFSRPECLPIDSPGEAKAYSGSGSTAVREQDLSDPARTYMAVQAVVLFPSAQQAAAFFKASSQSWQACSDGSFVNTLSGGREVWDVGPISNTKGILSTVTRMHTEEYDGPTTNEGAALTGQRVLTVRNNVVVDIAAASSTANDSAGVNIAQQIAAKVPSG